MEQQQSYILYIHDDNRMVNDFSKVSGIELSHFFY